MKTKQLYLSNAYLKKMTASILEVYPEAERKWRIVLSETVFYPMGGGQPTDQGILYCEGWKGKVYQVLLKEGEIFHYIEAESPPLVGMRVEGEIDWERRYPLMRYHSAGHVIDFAVYLLGYSPGILFPLKADHGKKSAIWYRGKVEGADFLAELEAKANWLVAQNLPFTTQFVLQEELKDNAIYLQSSLPSQKSLRLLTLESVGSVADGGTQVYRTGEVGPIQILSIENKGEETIIRYKVKK